MKKIFIGIILVVFMVSFGLAAVGCKEEAPAEIAKQESKEEVEASEEAAEESEAQEDKVLKLAMITQQLGNPFFEACKQGGEQAEEELGFEFIYQAPENPTAEQQIEVIDAMIAQKVDAVVISANDEMALVPICQKAMDEGIRVISWDSAVGADGREAFVSIASNEQIGRIEVQVLGEILDYKGQIAILSASSTMTNSNEWISWMEEELKDAKYENMELVAIAYGDDVHEKAYNEANGLFKSYPDLRGIISPTTVGMAAAGKAIEDAGLTDVVELTGLGLPSEMAEYILNGTCKKMVLWSPVELGYFSMYFSYLVANGDLEISEGNTFSVGDLGEYEIVTDADGEPLIDMDKLMVFDADNINDWKDVF